MIAGYVEEVAGKDAILESRRIQVEASFSAHRIMGIQFRQIGDSARSIGEALRENDPREVVGNVCEALDSIVFASTLHADTVAEGLYFAVAEQLSTGGEEELDAAEMDPL